MLNDFFYQYEVEEFTPYTLNNAISKIDIEDGVIIFFNDEDGIKINQYLLENYDRINSDFSSLGKMLINISEVIPSNNFEDLIKYYVPHLFSKQLSKLDINFLLLNEYADFLLSESNNSNYYYENRVTNIFKYLGYEGSVKNGLIYFEKGKVFVIKCDDIDFVDYCKNPFIAFYEYFQKLELKKLENREFNSRRRCKIENPYENLEEDALIKVNEFELQLAELKKNGQLLIVLPVLKKILNDAIDSIDLNTISILIVEDNRIILPYFDNLEVPLSHLTKVVYLLFYNNPEGINIKELYNYKDELVKLYLQISTKLDYVKMLQSIEDLVNPESKAIYTHISRVKSTFYKMMDNSFAKNYIITSAYHGSDFKYIPIILKKTDGPAIGRKDF